MAKFFNSVTTPRQVKWPKMKIGSYSWDHLQTHFLKMEDETLLMKAEIKELLKIYTERLSELENLLYQNRKQRPYNLPQIRLCEKEYQTLDINVKAFKDRLEKLDGCF